MKKLFIIVLIGIVLVAGRLYATANSKLPPLKDGDLVFHTSTSSQSGAIFIATADLYTHMGIIKHNGEQIVVVEAGRTVKETPLKDWVNRGVLKRVSIYRDSELTPTQAKQILSAARQLYGKPYDIFFSFKNDAVYCSELPYISYKAAGISIGTVQKVSELNFDNALVRKLIEQRWQRNAECKVRKYDFQQCYDYILNQDLVTPASIARDSKFKKIYSTYPL